LRRENPPITGPDVATATLASQFMDKLEFNKLLEKFLKGLEAAPGKGKPGVRLMVSGGACDDIEILDLLEHLDYAVNLISSTRVRQRATSGSRSLRGEPISSRRSRKGTSAGFRVLQRTMFPVPGRKKGSGTFSSS